MKLLDVVALTKDLPKQSIYKGQVGMIVEAYDSDTFEVEFVDLQGKTYAVETLNADQVMQLHYRSLSQTAF
ncbi:DUF4926 domain-containing protein [Leptolyngbya sp. NIES-2104]|uniref:DUF4926 domain-containing protein n=1 Tax=Leptolyngbya sp. NIES-2104 TaxID=1552121 RepID=UPI0006EC57D4|nr:DUF4926 domain-containing protein [Leptolyngbya sp. NIES-2104]GAP97088.1 hypothetical protein NIES2104_36350 [Leptolyngbya sp. NIES-2104]